MTEPAKRPDDRPAVSATGIVEPRPAVDDRPEAPIDRPDAEDLTEAAFDKSIGERIQELVRDGRALVQTELAYYRAKLDANVSATKRIGVFAGLGLGFATAGLIAIVLGALLSLAPILGPALATVVVALVFILVALIFFYLAMRMARRLPVDSKYFDQQQPDAKHPHYKKDDGNAP